MIRFAQKQYSSPWSEYYKGTCTAEKRYEMLLENSPRNVSPDHMKLLKIEKKLEGMYSGDSGPRLRVILDGATVVLENPDYRRSASYNWTRQFGWIDLDRRQVKDIRKELLETVGESMKYWKAGEDEDWKFALRYLEALKRELQGWRR